ncbi:TonB-dependent siderophore receptor [Herbaspirillum sp. alder98]|uniref:TonB-dependent siderophore receptor n=1 Tax=Herbaspirillum sp. alder98 TaxID=2913096 RepID=UPI001CD8975B|nr:TonB-dependent siderophore receptor [Herbaspirillum sp. alder98]MCA1326084.1 TonB-dependent siderophore receptor [Herbaspirillum sp. alder98]
MHPRLLTQPRALVTAVAAACAVLAAFPATAQTTSAQPDNSAADAQASLPVVTVTAGQGQAVTEGSDTYTVRESSSATRFALSPRETPQGLTVTTRAKMDDFKLNTVNDVLANTAGLTVDKSETDRTYFSARGFDVTNFMFDGVGVPLTYSAQAGDLDTALFDRVEVLSGANGLSASTGNPSATINFVRKRPTPVFQASAGLTLSSWNTKRLDADISTPINEAGTVSARLVAAHQEGNSYLDRYQPTKDLIYGVVQADLSSSTVATLGYSYQKVHSKGAMWGALPLTNADGTWAQYGVGASTSADWAYYDTKEQRTFAELNQKLGEGWQWKTSLNYDVIDSDSSLFYVAGAYDAATGTGLMGFPSTTTSSNKRTFVDSNVGGKFSLFGREHDLNVGLSWSRSKQTQLSRNTDSGAGGYYLDIPLSQAFGGAFPVPVYNGDMTTQAYSDTRKTLYAATRLNLHDRVKLLLGANYTQADSSGYSESDAHVLSQSAVSPYAGLVVDLSRNISAFGNYSKIFNPQSQVDLNHATLAAAKGDSYELGLKGEFFERRLNTSASIFRVKQSGLADYAGSFADLSYYYKGINARSEGAEFNLNGELARNWQAGLGFVTMRITDDEGVSVRSFVPRRQLRMSTTYRLPQLEQFKVGASLLYQGKTSSDATNSAYQGGYSVLNLMSSYEINKNLSVSFNLNNVFNKKYFYSVKQGSGYYAPPINGSLAINWKY